MTRSRALLCLLFLAAALPSKARSAFLDPYWSARVAALGGAFTALSDDPAGTLYNAAATVKVKRPKVHFTYARLFQGLDEATLSLSQFGYVHPVSAKAAFGLAWASFETKDLYREDTGVLTYARRLEDWLAGFGYKGEFSLGVSVRYLTQAFHLDERTRRDPVFINGGRNQAYTVDAHIYAAPDPEQLEGLSLGLSLRSLNQPNLGYRQTERLPKEVAAGLLYRWDRYALPVDVTLRANEITPHMGLEAEFLDKSFKARVGSDLDQVGTGFGIGFPITRRIAVAVDYGFLWPLKIEKTAGSHRATVGLEF
ncbi:MAG: hypothetical protein A2902_03090 [Elusimicrobia bacterium RIFCSPLOWO2_01_FULL_64_13]|nr:MAG: hypothetical protein A2902_03090 [Elusimicrobia bacterium RIFCSPLOWO2_01_FULL_64_13]